jgi:Ni/Co efflux regulator RcnB
MPNLLSTSKGILSPALASLLTLAIVAASVSVSTPAFAQTKTQSSDQTQDQDRDREQDGEHDGDQDRDRDRLNDTDMDRIRDMLRDGSCQETASVLTANGFGMAAAPTRSKSTVRRWNCFCLSASTIAIVKRRSSASADLIMPMPIQ